MCSKGWLLEGGRGMAQLTSFLATWRSGGGAAGWSGWRNRNLCNTHTRAPISQIRARAFWRTHWSRGTSRGGVWGIGSREGGVLGRRSPQPPSIKRPWDVPPPPKGRIAHRIFFSLLAAPQRARRAPPTSIFKVIFRLQLRQTAPIFLNWNCLVLREWHAALPRCNRITCTSCCPHSHDWFYSYSDPRVWSRKMYHPKCNILFSWKLWQKYLSQQKIKCFCCGHLYLEVTAVNYLLLKGMRHNQSLVQWK